MNKCLIFSIDQADFLFRRPGPYRIAHYLREHSWDCEVIDFAAHWPLEKLKQLAKQRIDDTTKFIGLSHMFLTDTMDVIDEFFIWLKETYPHLKIISGSQIKYRFKSSYIDYDINGFGEKALLELLSYLFENGPPPKFGLINATGKNIPANDFYPAYPMSSLNIIYQDRDFILPHEWLGIEFSRGCMFSCAYCNFPVLGVKTDHTRDAEDFRIQVTDAYDRFGVTNYYVTDETFNDRTEKITKYADVVETLHFKPYFTGFIRPDLLISRPKEREELLRMNFLGQFYGIETFNTETGKLIGKGMAGDKIKNGLIELRKYFESNSKHYRATLSFIAGLPRESKESILKTRQWLIDNWKGQNFSYYALEIPESVFDSPSKIGQNWKNYGYTDASLDAELADFKITNPDFLVTGQLIWKNDMMNIKEAIELSDYIEELRWDPEQQCPLGNFALPKIGLGESLDERLKILESSYDSAYSFPVDFINNYIEKKLNV